MPSLKLSEHIISSIQYQAKPAVYRDTEVPGFYLYVGTSTKTYMLQKLIHGKDAKISIGRTTTMSLVQARKRVAELCVMIQQGIDPRIELKKEIITVPTVYDGFVAYLSAKTLKASSIQAIKLTRDTHLADWRNSSIDKISVRDVQVMHQKLAITAGTFAANKAMRHFRALCSHAIVFYGLLSNPVSCLSATKAWFAEPSRKGYLRQQNYKPWHTAVLLEDQPVQDYILVLLYTGLRRTEVLKIMWVHLDMDKKHPTLTIPPENAKNKEEMILPITKALYQVFEHRNVHKKSDIWVFEGNGKTGHLVEPKKAIRRINDRCGIKITFHDLRRSYATLAEGLDLPAYALKRLLNHKSSDVSDITARYIIKDPERLRAPAEKVAQRIQQLLKGKI